MKIKKSSIISKMPISSSNMTPIQKVLFSLIFLSIGGYIQGISLDLFPFKGKVNAPREVIFLCGFVFFSAGVLILFQGISGVIEKKIRENKYRSSKNSPWLWDYRWNRKGINTRSQNTVLSHILGFSIMMSFWGITYWLGFINDAGFKLPFYGVSLLMVYILLWFYTMISKRVRYGRAYLSFLSFPYYLGDYFKGQFENLPPKEKIKEVFVTIRFYEEVFQKDYKGRTRISLKEIYANEVKYSANEISSSRSLEVDIQIPDDEKLNTFISESPARFWEAQIQCDIEGWDYREYFLVPIYKR